MIQLNQVVSELDFLVHMLIEAKKVHLKKSTKLNFLILIYALAFSIGVLWTYIPSIGNLLTNVSPISLSSEQYGSLILPLVIGAICSSNFSGWLGHYVGIRTVLAFGYVFIILSMIFLVLSVLVSNESAYFCLLPAQFLLGIAISAIMTIFNVYLFFVSRSKSAMYITAFYAAISIGGSACPLLVNLMVRSQPEIYKIPSIALAVFTFAIILVRFFPKIAHSSFSKEKMSDVFHKTNPRFWLFFFVAIAYGITESVYSDWGTIYLHEEKQMSTYSSNLGLSIFWGSLSLSQLSIAFLVNWIRPKIIYRILPIIIVFTLLAFIKISDNYLNYFVLLSIAGIGCSGFFPLSVNFSEYEFSEIPEIVSGSMVSGYFIGSGLGASAVGFIHKVYNLKLSSIFLIVTALSAIMGICAWYLVRGKNSHQISIRKINNS